MGRVSDVAPRIHAQRQLAHRPLLPLQAHPVALACAYECVKHLVKHDLPGHAANLEEVMLEWHEVRRAIRRNSAQFGAIRRDSLLNSAQFSV